MKTKLVLLGFMFCYYLVEATALKKWEEALQKLEKQLSG
jgi:hypothetical protein